MLIYDYSEYDNVYCSGDIHGEYLDLLNKAQEKDIKDALLIVAGDCSIGFKNAKFYQRLYSAYRQTLEKNNLHLIFVRGNHDIKAFFDGFTVDYKYMHAIQDYSIIKSAHNNILSIGGSVSLDRLARLDMMKDDPSNIIYSKDELIDLKLDFIDDIKANNILVDTVITHDCPSFAFPFTLNKDNYFLQIDPDLESDIKAEKQKLDTIYKILIDNKQPLKQWFFGHYHTSCFRVFDSIEFNLLNILEIKKLKDSF